MKAETKPGVNWQYVANIAAKHARRLARRSGSRLDRDTSREIAQEAVCRVLASDTFNQSLSEKRVTGLCKRAARFALAEHWASRQWPELAIERPEAIADNDDNEATEKWCRLLNALPGDSLRTLALCIAAGRSTREITSEMYAGSQQLFEHERFRLRRQLACDLLAHDLERAAQSL